MKNNFRISPLKPQWVEKIARIHFDSLPSDFLPKLGLDFLTNTFYPAVLSSTSGKVFIAVNIFDEPVGFVLVTLDSNGFLTSILKNRFWDFLKIGISSSFISRENLRNNFHIVLSSIFSKSTPDIGEIYIIAIENSFRGKGIGKLLIKKSFDFLKENSIGGIKIKTLSSNTGWIEHFLKDGWKLANRFQMIGKEYVNLTYYFDDIFPSD